MISNTTLKYYDLHRVVGRLLQFDGKRGGGSVPPKHDFTEPPKLFNI